MPKNNVIAQIAFRQKNEGDRNGRVVADVPAAVRDLFGAQAGDTLVFERGNTHVADRAAVPGPYLVVTIRRAQQPAAEERAPEDASVAAEPAAPIEPFEEFVGKWKKEQH